MTDKGVNDNIKQKESWQIALSNAVTDPKQLFERLQLNPARYSNEIRQASEQFSVFVTESYLSRIESGNPDDPLLLQVLPTESENLKVAGYSVDPLEEQASNPIPGLLHKYEGRALLITNAHCAINCRFCFRRNFPYSQNHLSSHSEKAIWDYLHTDTSIEELILSGGDPLLLSNKSLANILSMCKGVPHIRRIRIHSRVPIVLPERINPELIAILKASQANIIMVIHCNHAREIDPSVEQALEALGSACHTLLNQSVLLKHINNCLETQIELQKRLFECGVQPYYLHMPDKIKGTAHFDIETSEALSLYNQMQKSLPGYLVPRLVREIAGESHKTRL